MSEKVEQAIADAKVGAKPEALEWLALIQLLWPLIKQVFDAINKKRQASAIDWLSLIKMLLPIIMQILDSLFTKEDPAPTPTPVPPNVV